MHSPKTSRSPVQFLTQTGIPLRALLIMVDGTSIGTTTNAAGQYSLSAPADGTLSVTFIGYVGQQLPIAGKSRIDVTMHEDTQAIDDVIVVAFGTSKGGVYRFRDRHQGG